MSGRSCAKDDRTVTANPRKQAIQYICTHTQRWTEAGHGAKWMQSFPPYFSFNSRRTRLKDPISSDIEPGTPWNGTPERPNHSAPPQWVYQIPSRRSRWLISSSFFSRWDYLPGFKAHKWIFTSGWPSCHADVGHWCWVSSETWQEQNWSVLIDI